MYDIVIVGLGPAGSTFARLLDKNLKVLILDKKDPDDDNSFKKPCGGLLAPDAQKSLARFGLTLPSDVLVAPQIFAVKTIDTKSDLIRHYQRFYINLDRHKFDLWLGSLIPKSFEKISHSTCLAVEKQENGYCVRFTANGEEKTVNTRYIVGADGANSVLRKVLYKRNRIPTYISIQEWYREEHSVPFYSSIFDPQITDSYCWSCSKDDNFIIGGAFPIKTAKKKMKLLKEKLASKHGFIFGEMLKTEACLVLRPRWFSDFCTGKGGAFLIGEAAGFISPSSLEGLSYAFDSAYQLSRAFNSSKKSTNLNASYKRKTFKIRLKLILKHLKSPFMYWSWLRYLVMKSRFQSITLTDDK